MTVVVEIRFLADLVLPPLRVLPLEPPRLLVVDCLERLLQHPPHLEPQLLEALAPLQPEALDPLLSEHLLLRPEDSHLVVRLQP